MVRVEVGLARPSLRGGEEEQEEGEEEAQEEAAQILSCSRSSHLENWTPFYVLLACPFLFCFPYSARCLVQQWIHVHARTPHFPVALGIWILFYEPLVAGARLWSTGICIFLGDDFSGFSSSPCYLAVACFAGDDAFLAVFPRLSAFWSKRWWPRSSSLAVARSWLVRAVFVPFCCRQAQDARDVGRMDQKDSVIVVVMAVACAWLVLQFTSLWLSAGP